MPLSRAWLALPLLLVVVVVGSVSPSSATAAGVDDAKALYEAKCADCHGAAAQDGFDPARSDDALVEAVLEGRGSKAPPDMPAFKSEGIDAGEAKALVAYMRELRSSR